MKSLQLAVIANLFFSGVQALLLGLPWKRMKRAERNLRKLNESPFPWMHQPMRSKNGSSQPSHS